MSDKILEAKMLGVFTLIYDGREIALDRNSVSKTTQLLQILLLHAEDGISKAGLADALYGRGEVENLNSSLNNTIFRLRRQLRAAGLPADSNYINIRGGMCSWDESIPVQLDTRLFEELVALAEEAEDEEQKAELCRRACSIYTGEFLPNMIGEDWAAVRNVRYRDMYFNCADLLCQWFRAQERYQEGYEVAKAAAAIYPFEDWQVWEIDFLTAMDRYKEAMEVYENASRLMFDELGLRPSPEMMSRFRMIGEKVSQPLEAIDDIRHGLREKDRIRGAYYCTFPSFIDIYHVFSRMMERNGISIYIMLCTLKDGKAQADGNDERCLEASAVLNRVIQRSLRRDDFYTKYNYAQYLVMLLEINKESCKLVSDRILRNFRQEARKEFCIDFYVASIAEVLPEEAGAPNTGSQSDNGS